MRRKVARTLLRPFRACKFKPMRFRFGCLGLGFFLGWGVWGYPLPPKEITKNITESRIQKLPLHKASSYEILSTEPRLHAGLYFDSQRQRLRVLSADAQSLLAYPRLQMLLPRNRMGAGEKTLITNITQVETWIYPEKISRTQIGWAQHLQGRFRIQKGDIQFVPENPDEVFWQIKTPFHFHSARIIPRTRALLASSVYPSGFVFLPARATQAYKMNWNTRGELIKVIDCPSGDRFIAVENFKKGLLRFVFLTESLVPYAYTLFDLGQQDSMPNEVSELVSLGDCLNFVMVGSHGLARLQYLNFPTPHDQVLKQDLASE
jgi:hypothetical protein